jgi:hypothetical protein
MGLFGAASVQVDPAFEACIVSTTDHGKKAALKVLGKNAAGLRAMLRNDEVLLSARYHMDGVKDSLFVVTNQRSAILRKDTVRRQLAHSDVAETKIGTLPNRRMLVTVESHESRLDYAPNDPMRFEKIMQLEVETPREAQAICAVIDQHLATA